MQINAFWKMPWAFQENPREALCGHDCIVYWMIQYWSCHWLCWNLNGDGWLWECSSSMFFSPSWFWPNTGNSVIRWICASWWQVCEEPCPQQKEEALDFVWLCATDCQQSRRFDCNKQMIRDVRCLCHPCHPSFWPMCLTVAVSRRLSKSRLPLRKMKLPHPRWVMLLYWVFRCF